MEGVELLPISPDGVPEYGRIGVCGPLEGFSSWRSRRVCEGRRSAAPSPTELSAEGVRGRSGGATLHKSGACGPRRNSIHDVHVILRERAGVARRFTCDQPSTTRRMRCETPRVAGRRQLVHKKRCRISRSRPTDSYKESLPIPSLRHQRSGPFPLHGEHEDHSLARVSPARLCFCSSSGLQLVAQLSGPDAHAQEPVLGQLGVQEEPGQARLDLAADHVAQLPGP